MRKILIIALVALAPTLAGCATAQKIQDSLSVVTSAQISPKGVVVAVKVFRTLEDLATQYLNLPRCDGSTPICRDPGITAKIIPAVQKGRQARDSLKAFQRAHPGQLGSQGAYDALNASIDTLRNLISQNTGAVK